jgi:hypothetical protein
MSCAYAARAKGQHGITVTHSNQTILLVPCAHSSVQMQLLPGFRVFQALKGLGLAVQCVTWRRVVCRVTFTVACQQCFQASIFTTLASLLDAQETSTAANTFHMVQSAFTSMLHYQRHSCTLQVHTPYLL